MSDRSSSASEWISSLWQDTWPAIHSGGQVQLTARWIFPVCGPPIEHGVLEIADGRIAGLQPLAGRSRRQSPIGISMPIRAYFFR